MAEENSWQEVSYELARHLDRAAEAAGKAADASMAAYNKIEDGDLNFKRLSAMVRFHDKVAEAYNWVVKLHNTPQSSYSLDGRIQAIRNELQEMVTYLERAYVQVAKIEPTMFEFTALKTYESDLKEMYKEMIELRILQTAQSA